jgi:hypothetical protein
VATRGQSTLPGLGASGVRRVRRGVDQQLAAQRALGHIEPVDTGLIAIARTLADALDDEHVSSDGSRFVVATLAGRLVPVLLELRGERRDVAEGFDLELERIVDAIRNAPRP